MGTNEFMMLVYKTFKDKPYLMDEVLELIEKLKNS
jgi:hypothetical protein